MTKLFAPILRAFSGGVRSILHGGWASTTPTVIDALEPRAMMAVNVITAIPDTVVQANAPTTVVNLAGRYDNPDLNGTISQFHTVMGDINVLLYDQANPGVARTTPLTVANFLQYINAGRWTDTIFHRSVAGFIIQGGGFIHPNTDNDEPLPVSTFPTVQNEPGISNLRGTIAMAKQGGNPNSATSQWFFNLANNASNLDNQNGGFTVFGRVIKGLDVMDAIANVPTFNFGGAFTDLPLRSFNNGEPANPSDYISMGITTIPELTYSVTSSNATLVAPSLNGTNLTLAYGANATGAATITVRCTSADGSFVDDVFTVRINSAPVLANFAPSSANVGRNTPFTLSLGTATDDAGITRIDFYRDTNGNGTLETGTDALIGTDTSADGGWNLATNTNNFQLGSQRYFAVATDSDAITSATQTTTITVTNAAPIVSALTVSPNPAEGRVPVTLTATASDADGSVAFVRFYRDSDRNGILDTNTDALLGEDSDGSNGYSATFDTTSFTFGDNRYFAVATDGEALAGIAASATGTINSPFAVGTLTIAPSPVLRNAQVVLTASDVFIPTGKKLKKIEFYADSNNNGQYDDGIDKRVGSASSLQGGLATARVNTKGLPLGGYKFFARVQDNLNAWSPITTASVTILNNTPTVKSMKAAPNIVKNLGDQVQLSVSGQKDVDGKISSVRYYRDTPSLQNAPDGQFDPATDSLLGTVTNSSGGYKLTLLSSEFAVGLNRYFAVVVDTDGVASAPVTTTNIINAPPTITTFTASPDSGPAATTIFTFSASGVGDSDGTIKQVEIFLDSNGNGVLDAKIDKSLGKAKLVGNVWTLTVKGKGYPLGSYKAFARATDNAGGFSAVVNTNFAVV